VAALSGWGNGLFDFDDDGWKDLFTANAHVNDAIEMFSKDTYLQANSLSSARGTGRSWTARPRPVSMPDPHARIAEPPSATSTGTAGWTWVGDGAGARLRSSGTTRPRKHGHWLDVRLVGTKSNRDGIGAVVRIASKADPRWREQFNTMTSAVGYASSSAGPVHFGTGAARTLDVVEIRWPSGAVQTLENVPSDQVLTVRERP
jgi:hypothetical protein